ncbi:MAG: MFS transporter [Gammaproteobacteria bacterium]|nr:MFS transporter [Gammaproteobacteria bacterium]
MSTAIPTRRAGLWALGVLTAVNLVNYLDRYVVPPIFSDLKSAMQLSDTKLGLLLPAFLIVYSVAAPLFGARGDRGARPRLIAGGVFVWSLATALSGIAQSYEQLFAARALVGIGEAAYVAIAPALLADFFHAGSRGRVFAVLNMAIPVGSALGYIVGGEVSEHLGWRAVFYVAGAPGLLLAAALVWLPDPPRGAQDGAVAPSASPGRSALAVYLGLLRRAPYRLLVLGYAAYTFALGGLAAWMPSFLERVHEIPKAQASTGFGAIVVITGFLGTFAGGWLGDYCLRYSRQAYLWFSGATTLLAVPFVVVALTAAAPPVYYGAIVIGELMLFMSTGPVNAAIVNVVSPFERASAMALCMLLIHLLGDVHSPWVIGWLSDHSSLAKAVLIVPVAVAIGGLIWLAAARTAARASPVPA